MPKSNKDFQYNYKYQDKHFRVGNKVLLYLINIKTCQLLNKLNIKYLGPF